MQLELFESESVEELPEVDFIFEKEEGGYRMIHAYYSNDSRIGSLLTAEEALDCIRFHNNWYQYSAVSFNNSKFLSKRKH